MTEFYDHDRPSCQQCGACCRWRCQYPIDQVIDYAQLESSDLPATLKREWLETYTAALSWAPPFELPCPWLELTVSGPGQTAEYRCAHYQRRPEECRAYRLAGNGCREQRAMWNLPPAPLGERRRIDP